MKVKFIGEKMTSPFGLLPGKIYECLGKEDIFYRVIDESEEDYLYPTDYFEVVDEEKIYHD